MATSPHSYAGAQVRAHTVQFYSEDEPLIQSLEELISATLHAGDAVVCVVTRPHAERLTERLHARGPEASAAHAKGRYLPLGAEDTLERLTVDGEFDAKRFTEIVGVGIERVRNATGKPDGRVVIIGEMVALLWAQQKAEDVIHLEGMWNDMARVHEFSLRCCYPIAAFDRRSDEKSFLTICSQHSSVIPSETYPLSGGEDQRLRAVAALQQNLEVLRAEIAQLRLLEHWNSDRAGEKSASTNRRTSGDRSGPSSIEGQRDLPLAGPNSNLRRLDLREPPVRYPEWQPDYEAAVLEGDILELDEKVEAAETKILKRLEELQQDPRLLDECRDLMCAWGIIRLIRRRKLGLLQ